MNVPLRDMIKTTWAWAEAKGKLFRHSINGAEYVKVPVDELERAVTEKGEGMQHRADAELEDANWTIFDPHAETEDMPERGQDSQAPPPSLLGLDLPQGVIPCRMAVLCVLRLKGSADKIQFPAVSQNTNPYQVLATFLVILGRKIDLACNVKDMC